jgi:hypothetical protein
MKKIIKRCVTKAEADKLKDKAIKMGFRASSFQRSGKYACMISSDQEIPEEIVKAFLGNCRNMAK